LEVNLASFSKDLPYKAHKKFIDDQRDLQKQSNKLVDRLFYSKQRETLSQVRTPKRYGMQ
jgi:hypothetical protein